MSAVIDILNRAGELWWRYVPHVVWQASVLAVVVLIVLRLGRRWPSPLRYWLLVIALAKFAMPPLLSLPVGVFSRVGPQLAARDAAPAAAVDEPAQAGALTIPVADVARPPESDLTVPAAIASEDKRIDAPTAEEPATRAVVETDQGPSEFEPARSGPSVVGTLEPAPGPAARSSVDWKAWLLLVHAVGFLVVAAWAGGQLVVLHSTVRRARDVAEGKLHERFLGLWRSISSRRPPRLRLSDDPIAPMVIGVLRPVVVIPAAATESLPPEQLDTMLAHEFAHVRRRDTWINWFQLALTAVWWFNPLLWLLNRAVRTVREECCDDLVLAGASSSNDAYCETLLHAASRLAACKPVGARLGFADRLHPLGARLKRIMDRTLRRAPALTASGVVLIAVLAVVLLPGLGCRRTEKEPIKQGDAQQWQALVDEQKKIIDEYRAELERLQQDTGAAKVLVEQVAYWERKLADEEAELLEGLIQFGEEHPEIKARKKAIELYKQKLDEARTRAASALAETSLGPVEPGCRPELNDGLLHAAREGNLVGVRSLLGRGAFVSTLDGDDRTPLHWALIKGYEEIALLLIEHGAAVNVADNKGQTPLHVAAYYGRERAAEQLIAEGANLDSRDDADNTPLYAALSQGHAGVVEALILGGAPTDRNPGRLMYLAAEGGEVKCAQLLINAGVDLKSTGSSAVYTAASAGKVDMLRFLLDHGATSEWLESGGPILHAPLEKGHTEAAAVLLDAGADPDARDRLGNTPLHVIFGNYRHADAPQAVALLIAHKADLNATDKQGLTPLHLALREGWSDVVALLLEGGADPDIRQPQDGTSLGRTPLWLAIWRDQVESVRALLDAGAAISVEEHLFAAISKQNKEVVQLLIDHGVDVREVSASGYTALHVAARAGSPEITQVLIEAGADLEAGDTMSRTPLFLAAEEGHTEVVKLLLTKGAKVDARDKNDDTPLMRAVGGREPALEVCAALVEAGADVNARDNMARTPLHFAAVAGKEEIVRSLLEKGASPTAKDKSGKTPADYASSARIKQLLVEAAAGKGAEDAGAADSGKTELPPAPQPKRAWGPEQATGEPDTKSAGDIRTAWASKTPDAQDEWLELDYAEALTPAAVKVYETYNPGALHKVSVCDSGGKEIVVWEGDDPTPSTTNMGVSEIAFTSNVKAKRVKLYLKSKEVKGWNEIDAVGLVDTDGTMHWAVSATASSTYAE